MPEQYYKVTQQQLINLAAKSYTAGYFDSGLEFETADEEHIEARVALETCLSCPITEE